MQPFWFTGPTIPVYNAYTCTQAYIRTGKFIPVINNIIRHYATKVCVGVEMWLHHFLTSTLNRGEWSASRFTPGDRDPDTYWIWGWFGPRAGYDAVEKRKSLAPPRNLIPVTKPTELSRLLQGIHTHTHTRFRIVFLDKKQEQFFIWKLGEKCLVSAIMDKNSF
jgi:hypothetical protein